MFSNDVIVKMIFISKCPLFFNLPISLEASVRGQKRFIMLQLDLLQIQAQFGCLRAHFYAGLTAPKENPKLTLFTLKLAFLGKQNSNCVPGSKLACTIWCKVQCCSYVPTISTIRCETAEKLAKNRVFGAIIQNKRVRGRK